MNRFLEIFWSVVEWLVWFGAVGLFLWGLAWLSLHSYWGSVYG